MSDPQPPHQLRAVDIKAGHGVVAARIVDGKIEAHRAAAILDAVRKAVDEQAGDLQFVVLDFGDVDFVNSSGVAACLELAAEVKQKGARAVIYRPADNVAEILRLVKADRVYTIVRTLDELANLLGA